MDGSSICKSFQIGSASCSAASSHHRANQSDANFSGRCSKTCGNKKTRYRIRCVFDFPPDEHPLPQVPLSSAMILRYQYSTFAETEQCHIAEPKSLKNRKSQMDENKRQQRLECLGVS